MYVNYDISKGKIISVTTNPLVTMKQNIVSKSIQVDSSEKFLLPSNFIAKYSNGELDVYLKPIEQIQEEYIKIINEFVQSLVETAYQDWGVTYTEIIAELHNTGLNIESKIYFLLKSEITTSVYGIGDIRSMAGEVAFGLSTIDDVISNLQQDGLVSVDLFRKYMDEYVDVIRKIDDIESAWSYVEDFEAEIKTLSTISDCNLLFSKTKSAIMNKFRNLPVNRIAQ